MKKKGASYKKGKLTTSALSNLSTFPVRNLENVASPRVSPLKINGKRSTLVQLDSDKPRVMSTGITMIPKTVAHLIGEHFQDSKERYYVESALANVQPITLCLSQKVGSKLAPFSSIGFLPSNQQWEPSDITIDKEYKVKDYKGCIRLLVPRDPNLCRVAVTVLVVKFSKTSRGFLGTLDDLRKTVKALKHQLASVKHVIISINGCISCCFTLEDTFDMETRVHQPVNHLSALFNIIRDLRTCWRIKKRLTVRKLFAFYFKSDAKPVSEMYLSKFVIPLNNVVGQALFNHEAAPYAMSSKIMWVCDVATSDDLAHIAQDTPRLCHAFRLNVSASKEDDGQQMNDMLNDVYHFSDNPSVERIVIHSGKYGGTLQLPRPMEPVLNAMPYSALIELTLSGFGNILHLTQLNNGYFPHLKYLSVLDGKIKGHLDSHHVPSLRTLLILPESLVPYGTEVSPLQEHTQSLIRAGRLWQLVATKTLGGWSLASYDEPTLNHQHELKEDAPHSPRVLLPLIRELLLVVASQEHVNEWEQKLKGYPSKEAAAEDNDDHLLIWAPQCVQKIVMSQTGHYCCQWNLTEAILEQTRILDSLICHDVYVALNGDTLPCLQTLNMYGGYVTLSGAFRSLKSLSFKFTTLKTPWSLDAPKLESLSCFRLRHGARLSLEPRLLPHLSFLLIYPFYHDINPFPNIVIDNQNVDGLSKINHVVFGHGMTRSPLFSQYQVNRVTHLSLVVDADQLLDVWSDRVWECVILELDVLPFPSVESNAEFSKYTVVLPELLQVQKLTVTQKRCRVLLNTNMPQLTECTVPSPTSLGPNLKCPKLKCIHFMRKLSKSNKKKYLDRNTYLALGAKPSLVYFDYYGEKNKMTWEVIPTDIKSSSLGRL